MEAEITLNISLHLQECNLDANMEKEDRRGKHFNCVLRYLRLMLCRTMSLYALLRLQIGLHISLSQRDQQN